MTTSVRDPIETAWERHRKRVFDLAYRMLGRVGEAEDIVSETFLRLTRTGTTQLDDVEGWLVTVSGRLCLDRLRSAERTRAHYLGCRLPEPLVQVPAGEAPDERVTMDETVRLALLVVLDRMTPGERTAFVLHDVFGLPFDEVARVIDRTPAACRQLASRARRRIADAPPPVRIPTSHAELDRVAHRFAAACTAGRFADLVAVLDPGADGHFDAGAAYPSAPRHPVHGATAIARRLRAIFGATEAGFRVVAVNGEPGVLITLADRVVAVLSLVCADDRVQIIYAVGDPDKLTEVQASVTGS